MMSIQGKIKIHRKRLQVGNPLKRLDN